MLEGSALERRLHAVVGARNLAESRPSRYCLAALVLPSLRLSSTRTLVAFVGEQIMRRVLICLSTNATHFLATHAADFTAARELMAWRVPRWRYPANTRCLTSGCIASTGQK